jgi:hypothetical protein
MPGLYAVRTRKPRRVLAWSALMTTTVVLASLLQAVATRAMIVPARAAPPDARLSVTAALADGDDIRARFLANLPDEAIDVSSTP